MTPLAQAMLRDMIKPRGGRRAIHSDGGDPYLLFREEFHAFEVTKIITLSLPVYEQMLIGGLPSIEWTFLPANSTWIEWREESRRVGIMLNRLDDKWAFINMVSDRLTVTPLGALALTEQLERCALEDAEKRTEPFFLHSKFTADIADQEISDKLFWIYAVLLLINTPKLINRKTHVAHRGLQRDLRRLGGVSFPLQAWTEILLSTETRDAEGTSAEATGLAGRVCLHWTRSHKRRIHGVWTLINDYWSGDGSLGIKQSRYSVTP